MHWHLLFVNYLCILVPPPILFNPIKTKLRFFSRIYQLLILISVDYNISSVFPFFYLDCNDLIFLTIKSQFPISIDISPQRLYIALQIFYDFKEPLALSAKVVVAEYLVFQLAHSILHNGHNTLLLECPIQNENLVQNLCQYNEFLAAVLELTIHTKVFRISLSKEPGTKPLLNLPKTPYVFDYKVLSRIFIFDQRGNLASGILNIALKSSEQLEYAFSSPALTIETESLLDNTFQLVLQPKDDMLSREALILVVSALPLTNFMILASPQTIIISWPVTMEKITYCMDLSLQLITTVTARNNTEKILNANMASKVKPICCTYNLDCFY
jgi:hypothetical protein